MALFFQQRLVTSCREGGRRSKGKPGTPIPAPIGDEVFLAAHQTLTLKDLDRSQASLPIALSLIQIAEQQPR